MFSLIETAYAMAPPAAPGGAPGGASALGQFIPLILIFVIFYFLLIRPQQKKAREHRALVSALRKGDEVYTDSGIRGTILKVGDDVVTLEIAPKVSIKMQRVRVSELIREAKGSHDEEDETPEAEVESKPARKTKKKDA
ncbi:MAG: preprotein translocase subunit YajC [Deltaproteobacteria bacterium]|nr:preprotein translocase subunit YajC [Deltaproteobacteria bacterium]